LSKEEIIEWLESRLRDYRSRAGSNSQLRLDIRADEVVALLKKLKEEN